MNGSGQVHFEHHRCGGRDRGIGDPIVAPRLGPYPSGIATVGRWVVQLMLYPCLASLAILGLLFLFQYLTNRERFEGNLERLKFQRELSEIHGVEDYDRARERKEMGLGLGARLYGRIHDLFTHLNAVFRYRPR